MDILKFGAPAIITSRKVIKARYDALLYQLEWVHLYNHPGNYTKNIYQ